MNIVRWGDWNGRSRAIDSQCKPYTGEPGRP